MSTKGITEADKHADAKSHYAEIFNLPHWEPEIKSHTGNNASAGNHASDGALSPAGLPSHPRMDITKRAAMFASFDALVGYKEAVSETARTTDGRIELSEGELEELGRRLMVVIDRMEEGTDNGELSSGIVRAGEKPPTVTITYFVPDAVSNPDSKKAGGEYRTVTGAVTKIDLYQRILTLADSSGASSEQTIRIDDVVKFDGELFDTF